MSLISDIAIRCLLLARLIHHVISHHVVFSIHGTFLVALHKLLYIPRWQTYGQRYIHDHLEFISASCLHKHNLRIFSTTCATTCCGQPVGSPPLRWTASASNPVTVMRSRKTSNRSTFNWWRNGLAPMTTILSFCGADITGQANHQHSPPRHTLGSHRAWLSTPHLPPIRNLQRGCSAVNDKTSNTAPGSEPFSWPPDSPKCTKCPTRCEGRCRPSNAFPLDRLHHNFCGAVRI